MKRWPCLTGLTATIADPSTNASEAPASRSSTRDAFDRGEQSAGRLVHNGACVLVSDVAHESRDGGETSAWALAAPVVAIAER